MDEYPHYTRSFLLLVLIVKMRRVDRIVSSNSDRWQMMSDEDLAAELMTKRGLSEETSQIVVAGFREETEPSRVM